MTDVGVVVVGLGAWGSAALWRLAARGVDVLGIEAHEVPHQFGSSHGSTRLFRVACHEHPGLTPLARASRDLLLELGQTTGTPLLEQSGLVSIGPPEGRAVGGARRALTAAGIDPVELSIDELQDRYPQHHGLPDHYRGLLDQEAGLVRVEESIGAAVDQAIGLGARVWPRTAVTEITPSGGQVMIKTASTTVTAEQVIVATGPWLSRMQDLVPLTPRRAPLLWWRAAADPAAYQLDRFPAFIRHYDDEHTIWGHGSLGDLPIKIGLSSDPAAQEIVDPAVLDRGMRPERDWAAAAAVITKALPGIASEPVSAAPCMITDSPDRQFVIGRHPDQPGVLLAGGCSGHGFKHALGIGELLARQAVGEEPFAEFGFVDPARFR
jgi:sarcosine oxidase